MFGSSSVKRFLATLHEGKCVWCSFFGPPSSNPNKLKLLLCFTKNFPHFRPVDKARWWWNQCNFHRLGWPGYSAPTEAPRCLNHHSDALGCAVQLLSPADSDGSDSFQRWPPVLTPIRAGWQWQTGAGSPHICWADTAEHRGGGTGCSWEPESTFNLRFSHLRLKFLHFTSLSFLHSEYIKNNPPVALRHLFKPWSSQKTLQRMVASNGTLIDGI